MWAAAPWDCILAALLLQDGVRVRVLEQRPGAEPHSRAIGIHPPALAALDRAGVAPALVAAGVPIRRGSAFSGGSELARRCPSTGVSDRFPFVLSLPQCAPRRSWNGAYRNWTPARCAAGARVTGHARRRRPGHRAVAPGAGFRPSMSARSLVGADGARSTVRRLLRVPVRAKDVPGPLPHGRFRRAADFGTDAALFLEEDGIVESFPLPGGLRRWVVRLDQPSRSVRDAAELAWLRAASAPGSASTPARNTMLSSFGVRSRLARRMVAGRTVLIGDAAHEISPIGGQGMNLGWLDAEALAPIICAALPGGPPGRASGFELRGGGQPRRPRRQSEVNMALGRPLPAWVLRAGTWRSPGWLPCLRSTLVARRFTMQ